MAKRLVVVGGVAAGASAAAKARRVNEDIEIVLVEAGPYVSFANCGLPYYIGGEIPERDDLFVVTADLFRKRFRIDVRLETVVTAVDPEAQTVTLIRPDGDTRELAYDRLVLATGTKGIVPPIEGIDRPNIFTLRTVPDVDAICARLDEVYPGAGDRSAAAPSVGHRPRALVIGGGYIGLEAAEQLRRRDLHVTLVERMPQLMTALDAEMALPLKSALTEIGCEVVLGDGVARIEGADGRSVAVTQSGREIPFDLAILAVGVRPNVQLAQSAGIALGPTGAICADALQRTSRPAIYAAGDNSETHHRVLGRAVNIPLAGPANKAGRVAGANAALDLAGASDEDPRRVRMPGVLGTAIARVGSAVAAVTGLTEAQARREGVPHAVMYMPGRSHAGYYPGAEPLLLKVLYEPEAGRLLGAQAVGSDGVDKRIDVLATAIQAGMTIEDLEGLDLCYAPPFGSAKDLQVLTGFAAANACRGIMPTITPAEVLAKLAAGESIRVLDVRMQKEWDAGHLEQAVHIPLDELRDRLDEVPADGPLAVHCAAGYRSYVAQQILLHSGRSEVYNVVGGYTVIECVQAAQDIH